MSCCGLTTEHEPLWTHSGHQVLVLLGAAKVLREVVHAEVLMLAGVDPSSVFLGIWDPVEENPKGFPNRLLTNCTRCGEGRGKNGTKIRANRRFDCVSLENIFQTFHLYRNMNDLKIIKTFIYSQIGSAQCDLNGVASAFVSVKVKQWVQQEDLILKCWTQRRHLKLQHPASYLHQCEKLNTHCPISRSLWEICAKLI